MFTRRHPAVPVALWSVIQRCTAVNPADRYTSVEALAGDLRDWLADRCVSAHRYSIPERLGRRARRHGLLLVAAGLTTPVLAFGAVLYQQKADAELAATVFRMQLGGYATTAAIIAAAAVDEGAMTSADFDAAAATARAAWVIPEASAGAWCSNARAVFVTRGGLVEWREGEPLRSLPWSSPVDVTCVGGNLAVLDASGFIRFEGDGSSPAEWTREPDGQVFGDGRPLGWRLDGKVGARFSADGRMIVHRGFLRVSAWDTHTGAYLGSPGPVAALMDRSRQVHADIMVEARTDGLDIYRHERLLHRILEPGEVDAVALAPDASKLLAIGADQRAWILSVDALEQRNGAGIDPVGVLSQTNLRTCPDLSGVVDISPFPAASVRWAPMDRCR